VAAYPRKAIVVGLDAVTPDFVLRMVSEGKLPNFKRFLDEGALAPHCLSSLPTSTPENWTSIATGAWNGTHQVMDFQSFQPEELKGRWMRGFTSREPQAEFIWDALERAGKRSILLKYPQSWPPTLKDGIVVCGCHVRPCVHQLDGTYLFSTVERPDATHLDLREAEGWTNLPVGGPPPLAGTITFGRRTEADREPVGLGVPVCKIPAGAKSYHVLVYGAGGAYDRLALCRARDLSTRIAELAPGQWSEWLLEDFETENGPRQSTVRFRLEELSPDATAVRLFSTQIIDVDHYTMPQSLGRELYEKVGPFFSDMGWSALGHKGNRDWIGPEAFLQLSDEQHDWFSAALRYLTRTYEWALAMMQVHCIDCANHWCLHLADPQTNPDADQAAHYMGFIEDLHVSLDRMLGRIMDDADEETLIVLVSDHGGLPTDSTPDVGAILADAGLAELDEEGMADPSRSLAYPVGHNFVSVNLQGRQPGGLVPAGDRVKVRERVIAALMEHVDPQTGRHPFTFALRKEDARILGLYGDPGCEKIGDVVFALREGFGANHGTQLSSADWGVGSNASLLAMRGPGVRRGVRLQRTAWLVDVAPTICYLLDAPVPRDCHGSVLYQALAAHPRASTYR